MTGVILIMISGAAVGIGLAHASWEVLGPLLAGRSSAFQAAVGAVCGAAAGAPAAVLLSSRRRRTAMVPTLCWLLAAAILFLWAVPFRRGHSEGAEDFLAQAGSYVPFSTVTFLVTAVVLLRRVPAEAFQPMTQWLNGERSDGGSPRRRDGR